MRRSSKSGKTDIYVFFAGHGLASQGGEQMYLLPFDGRPRLLDQTAILQEELFEDIASANPRSLKVFLDSCYSGSSRGTDMLIASRPIAIKALKQSVPGNSTVMTAASYNLSIASKTALGHQLNQQISRKLSLTRP